MNFQMFKLVLEKAEVPEIKLPTFVGSLKKQESSRKTFTSALLYAVFIPIPKKGNAKNAQTTAQLHSSHTLVK